MAIYIATQLVASIAINQLYGKVQRLDNETCQLARQAHSHDIARYCK